MIDDEDGKIRRNLVFASSAILIAAWLGVPGTTLLGSFAASLANTPPWKLTALGFALIGYLSYRYRFSEEGASLSRKLEQEVEAIANARMNAELTRLISNFRVTGVLTSQITPLKEVLEKEAKAKEQGNDVSFYIDSLDVSAFSRARIRVRLVVSRNGMIVGRETELTADIQWKKVQTFGFWVRSNFFGMIYNNLGPQGLAPVFLTLLAEGVLATRTFRHYADI